MSRALGAPGRLATLALLAACSRAPERATPSARAHPPAASAADASADGDPDAAEPLASLDLMAARGAADAPLMREAARVADVTGPVELSATADACFRAVVAARPPARAWFEDASGAPRGEVAEAGRAPALVPPRGPVCARGGEVLRLVVDTGGERPAARAVVWRSP